MNKPGLREGIWATGAAILLVSVLFTVYPQIDIAAARWFYRDGFAGAGSLARGLRGVL